MTVRTSPHAARVERHATKRRTVIPVETFPLVGGDDLLVSAVIDERRDGDRERVHLRAGHGVLVLDVSNIDETIVALARAKRRIEAFRHARRPA